MVIYRVCGAQRIQIVAELCHSLIALLLQQFPHLFCGLGNYLFVVIFNEEEEEQLKEYSDAKTF